MKATRRRHICALNVTTGGMQGAGLGGDEEEIVLLTYVILDIAQNQIVGIQQYVVRPLTADTNETILSEQVMEETSLNDQLIKTKGIPLENAIQQFDEYVRSLQIDPRVESQFTLVTDGQLHLRQCIHPESVRKNITLPTYYDAFHDLRKEFRFFYNVPATQELSSVTHLLNFLNMTHVKDHQLYVEEMGDIISVIQKLISDGHSFPQPERIQIKLEPGICWLDDEVDDNCVVRARGLPWQSSDQDIARFFRGLNIVKGGVALCLSTQGRRNGEALVRFINQEHRDMAQKRHKHHISNRYIEVYKASGEDFIGVAGGKRDNKEAHAFLTRGAQVIIRMRGLPYDCTAKEVMEFFVNGPVENSCTVMDGEEGVLFVKKIDGRATGDAFVLFAEEEDAPKALSKHRELIGTRYIELFRSTIAEVQQVLNRSMDPKTYETNNSSSQQLQRCDNGLSQAVQLPVAMPVQTLFIPQHVITSGTRKDCIRLRGLPFEANVEHILDFLGPYAKTILFQGVHMVYNAQGHPSGEAFIQMDSEESAFNAALMRHHRYMFFGKKQRYIEVFQCSGEDMNLVLAGVMTHSTSGPLSPMSKTAIISPGMLNPTTTILSAPNQIASQVSAYTTVTQSATPLISAQPTQSIAAAAAVNNGQQSLVSWDPMTSQVVTLQQALAHNQAVRSQQENIWILNQLALQQHMQQQQAQQQMQFAAIGGRAATAMWPQANGASSAAIYPAMCAPSVLTPSIMTQARQKPVTPTHTNVLSNPAAYIPHSSMVPSSSNAGAAQSMFFINIPKVETTAQTASSSAAAPLNSQINMLGLKRSWDFAFPTPIDSSALQSNPSIKRPYNPQVSTSTIFTLPPLNQPPPPIPQTTALPQTYYSTS